MAIVINEVQTGGPMGGFDEFIELYNSGDVPVSLQGFHIGYFSANGVSENTPVTFGAGASIPAHGYFLITGSNFSGALAGDASETQGLAAAGAGIALKDPMNQTLDSVAWGTATNAFIEGMVATAPGIGQSIARVSDGFDTNNNAGDFLVLSTPTPRNVATSPPPAGSSHLVISEVQTGGGGMVGGFDEFIELFNPTDTPVDLGGSSLVYRSATGTSDAGLFTFANGTVIAAHGHFLVASGGYTGAVTPDVTIMGGLAAGGGGIALRDAMAQIVDSVGWGMANNAFIEGGIAAVAPVGGESIVRIGGSQDTDNNAVDFVVSATPGPENSAGIGSGVTRDGDEFDNALTGTDLNDALRGLAGNDTLIGLGGADLLDGGDGVDYLVGGDGADTLTGGTGGDALHGQAGDDQILGNDGDDVGIGGPGSDTIQGESGNDTLIGDDGDDPVGGADFLYGGDGVDQIFGYALNDVVYGGADGDFVSGGEGGDTLYGGDGDDALHADAGNDYAYGETGNDVLVGYAGDDTLYGGADNDTIIGAEGNDTLGGDDGNDQIFGYDGIDVAYGGDGGDFAAGGAGNDVLYGGVGGDVLDGEADDDQLFGDEDGDNLNGNNGNDILYGGGGNDGLLGWDGDDYLYGGAGNDFLIGDRADGTGVRGNDTFLFQLGTGNDNVADFQGGAGAGDVIDISAFGFGSFGAVLMNATDVAGGTYILLHNYGMGVTDAILLEGFSRNNLSADDFQI